MKTLFNFYITSSIHVALAATTLVFATYYFKGLSPDFLLLSFVFFASISGYNFIKYAGMAKWYHQRLPHKVKWIQIFSFFSFLALVYCIWLLPTDTQILVGVLAFITLLYVIPIWPKSKNLRSISGLKIFIIALVWSATVVLLPLWHEKILITTDDYVLGVQVILLVIGLTIPFEIRDLDLDGTELRTLPQWLGVKRSKQLAIVCFVLLVILDFFKDDWPVISPVYWLFIALMGVVGVVFAKANSGKYYASFWIESIPIFGALLLILADLLFLHLLVE